MSESLEDVYKANETWEQALMGVCKESNFLLKKLDRSSDMEKKISYWDCSI